MRPERGREEARVAVVAITSTCGEPRSSDATSSAAAATMCSHLSTRSKTRLPASESAIEALSGRSDSSWTPRTLASAEATSVPSRRGASGTHHTPSGNESASSAASWSANRVFPVPPGPTSVSSRTEGAEARSTSSSQLGVASQERGSGYREIRPEERFQWRELAAIELVQVERS